MKSLAVVAGLLLTSVAGAPIPMPISNSPGGGIPPSMTIGDLDYILQHAGKLICTIFPDAVAHKHLPNATASLWKFD